MPGSVRQGLSMDNKRQWLCVTRDKFDQHHAQLVPQMVSRPTWMSQDNHLWSVLDDWWFCHASCHMAWTLREFGPRMSRAPPTILDCLRGIGGLRHKEPHRVGVARLRSIWHIAVQQSLVECLWMPGNNSLSSTQDLQPSWPRPQMVSHPTRITCRRATICCLFLDDCWF